MNKVNYREEDEIVNRPLSCTLLECSSYRMSRDGEIDITDAKEIQVYSIDMRKRKRLQASFLNRLLDLNMEQYINIKVCYCKIYIADIYI